MQDTSDVMTRSGPDGAAALPPRVAPAARDDADNDGVDAMRFRSTNVRFQPAAPRHGLWRVAGVEPALSEVLRDPVVHQVMRRDGVTFDELAAVIAQARTSLRRRLCCRLAA
jgi:hypothetical protein